MQTVLTDGPKGHWLFGNIQTLRDDPLGFAEAFARPGEFVYGRVVGPFTIYMANHPELVHEVLVTHRHDFTKSPFDINTISRFLGYGLLTSEGELHAQQRRLMQPAFHYGRIKGYAERMVDYTCAMLETWQHGQVRNIDQDMMALTLEIVTDVLFGTSVSAADARIVGAALDQLQQDTAKLSRRMLIPPKTWPLPINRRMREATACIDEVVYRIIEQRRASGAEGDDLLAMLLQARYEDDGSAMSDQQLRDEVITLLLAGHETTANTLTWTFFLLSKHPEVLEHLQTELDQVLGERSPTVDDLKQLSLTDMIIKESLRLYPPAWMISPRQALRDVKIGGHTIRKREMIMISPYTMHRDPRWWPNPDLFDPQRWTPEAEQARPRYVYIPFGGGDRICIGNTFAMMEARLLLATIAQRYTLQLYPGQQIEPEALITLGPKHGLWMQVLQRTNPAR